MCVTQLETGRADLENQYVRAVRTEGNRSAQALMGEVFTAIDRRWRGLDVLPRSALGLTERYAVYDAVHRFGLAAETAVEPVECHASEVLRGLLKPPQCPSFARGCSPDHPLGAPMVSAERACAAYFRAGRVSGAGTEAR